MAEGKPKAHPDFKKKSSTGMKPGVAVLVSHVGVFLGLGWLSGLIVYLLEKENKFVKFHAMQSLCIGIAEVGVWIVGFILFFIAPVIWSLGLTALFVFRVIIVIKAFNGELYKFPGFGVWADKWMKKF